MADPNFSAFPTHVVSLALATAKTDCQITSITVWLTVLEELADSVDFLTSNNLLPEVFAKAGVADSTYFNLIVEQEMTTLGDHFVYELKLSHQEV